MKRTMKRVGLILLILAAVIFYGRWFLDMFGLIKYDMPMSQSSENVAQIQLLDTGGSGFVVLRSLTGDEMVAFLEEFLQMKAGRYANDPPTTYGDQTVKICYADGGYDYFGDMIRHYAASGEEISTKGWYYISSENLEWLFEKYLPEAN